MYCRGFNIRPEQALERASELGERGAETAPSEQQEEHFREQRLRGLQA